MRLDKFLKVSRIIKRRTVAKKIADQGRILVNGKPAKSSSSVKAGDELTIQFGNKPRPSELIRLLRLPRRAKRIRCIPLLMKNLPRTSAIHLMISLRSEAVMPFRLD